MKKLLEGKVAIIVGSTSGMGEAAARLFAQEGASVVVTGRREAKGEQVAKEIEEAGGIACYHKLDCSCVDQCYDVVDFAVKKYGKLDILYYNAGVVSLGDPSVGVFGKVTEEYWDYLCKVNCRNVLFMAQKALPELKKTQGIILVTSSNAGVDPRASEPLIAYGALKQGLNQMVRIMALNVAADGIRVNAIAPGVTETEMLAQASPEVMAEVRASLPLKKTCEAIDQANAALFLASDLGRRITGQILTVDSGQTI